ncbi:hypothetical protein [Caudoviricetes sp.]|nr:hypothetical protein [Caudoviricetes sp.]
MSRQGGMWSAEALGVVYSPLAPSQPLSRSRV